jgi:hypothetical protein
MRNEYQPLSQPQMHAACNTNAKVGQLSKPRHAELPKYRYHSMF